MSLKARPKRAAEDFARTHNSSDEPSAKKPRFDIRNPSALAPDALEDDATLDADQIGKRGQQVRRNAVNIDGYDSDSENEAFDARAEARAATEKNGNGKSKDEEQEDMFADLAEEFRDGDDEEGETSLRDGRKKAVRFLDENEIEGQIEASKSGGHVSADFTLNGKGKGKARDKEVESSSESEVDDETRADAGADVDQELGAGGKKSHAPKLDAFNMRNENEEGRFDDQGNFVRKAVDPDAVHDSWLEGLSKKDMRKAKEAADKREEEQRQKNMADMDVLTGDLLSTLIKNLERGETALEALARLGRGKAQKPKWQNKNKNKRKATNGTTTDVEMAEEEKEDPVETKRKAAVESITEAADQLLTRGQAEIYDQERELLVRQYRTETGEDWVDLPEEPSEDIDTQQAEGKMWEYRWSDGRDGEIHGPYKGSTMVQWKDAGYFGEGVEFRRVGDTGEWSRLVDFV
ncbi:MAG: hypothetical protein Q9160_006803 [Pyrenula sp. 1 TL-2023]